MKTSALSKFYELSFDERIEYLQEFARLTDDETEYLRNSYSLEADRMIENVVSSVSLPLGIATYFKINDIDRLVPMALEEPSVVAAASHGAKMARENGFKATYTGSIVTGQMSFVGYLKDLEDAKKRIDENKKSLLDYANTLTDITKYGGGARDISIKNIQTRKGKMYVVEIDVDTRDAMGANITNTMCEGLAYEVQRFTGGKPLLRILSNYYDKRLVKAETKIKVDELATEKLDGDKVAERITEAYAQAESDTFRATTHNKGIMNGVDAVAIATGNDFRAIEAGAHAYAPRTGKYMPLSKWEYDGKYLEGELEMPMPVATVGGSTREQYARLALKILGVQSAAELAETMASVGLANNLAALHALVTEGINKGHMKLHARKFSKQTA